MKTLEQVIREQNKGLEEVTDARNGNDGWTFYHSKYEFENHIISITKSQWAKTQKTFCIRVDNYVALKKHFIQIPMDSLKLAKMFIEELKENGSGQFWTGHHVNSGKFIKRI